MKKVLFTQRSRIKSVSSIPAHLPIILTDEQEFNRACMNQQLVTSVFRTKSERNHSGDRAIRHQSQAILSSQAVPFPPQPSKNEMKQSRYVIQIKSLPLSPVESSEHLKYMQQQPQQQFVQETQHIDAASVGAIHPQKDHLKIERVKTENSESTAGKTSQFVQRSRSTYICKTSNFRNLIETISLTRRASNHHALAQTTNSTETSSNALNNLSKSSNYSKGVPTATTTTQDTSKNSNNADEQLPTSRLRRQSRPSVVVSSSVGDFSQFKHYKQRVIVKEQPVSHMKTQFQQQQLQQQLPQRNVQVKESRNIWNFEVNLSTSVLNNQSLMIPPPTRQPSRHMLKSRDVQSRRESIEKIFEEVAAERQPKQEINSISIEGNSVLKSNELLSGMKLFSNKLIVSSVLSSRAQAGVKKFNKSKQPVYSFRESSVVDEGMYVPPNVLCSNSMNKRNKSSMNIPAVSPSQPSQVQSRSNSMLSQQQSHGVAIPEQGLGFKALPIAAATVDESMMHLNKKKRNTLIKQLKPSIYLLNQNY